MGDDDYLLAKDSDAGTSTVQATADGIGEPLRHGAGGDGDAAEVEVEVEVTDDDAEEDEEEEEEDVDDMFAVAQPKRKKKKKVKMVLSGTAQPAIVRGADVVDAAGRALADNWDDSEGYYRVILGEQLDNGRYLVFSNMGKGMFSAVCRAKDTQQGDKEVAIKVIRSQETMYKAGQKEVSILNKLRELDPEDKKHVVNLERTFEHRGHLCLVFESLNMNLREVIKRFGKDIGINLRAVRTYAHQMLLALALFRKANIMHADIKPDNILVNNSKSILKICDLGSASDASENDITPYLVSRFYRAPEIILGLPYDCAIDMWSIGCTLYELFTGKILFPGRTNNQMLLLMMELKGKFTTRQIRKSKFAENHFDEDNNFLSVEKDRITGQDVVRKISAIKVTDLRRRILPGQTSKRLKDDDLRLHVAFIDLLNRCLELDPAKRITPKDALKHEFLSIR